MLQKIPCRWLCGMEWVNRFVIIISIGFRELTASHHRRYMLLFFQSGIISRSIAGIDRARCIHKINSNRKQRHRRLQKWLFRASKQAGGRSLPANCKRSETPEWLQCSRFLTRLAILVSHNAQPIEGSDAVVLIAHIFLTDERLLNAAPLHQFII